MARVLYTSDPIENDKGLDTPCGLITPKLNPISKQFFIDLVSNNKKETVNVIIRYFRLSGCDDIKKKPILVADTVISPQRSSVIGGTPVNRFFRFQIQILLTATSIRAAENVMFSVWGKDSRGNVIPFHRFLQKDFKKTILR